MMQDLTEEDSLTRTTKNKVEACSKSGPKSIEVKYTVYDIRTLFHISSTPLNFEALLHIISYLILLLHSM
jgi:hypothetical protein